MTLSPNTVIQCLFLLILSAKTLQPLTVQANEGDHQPPARVIALNDITNLELDGGLTFEFVCGDRDEVSIHAAETRFYKVSRRANNLMIKQKTYNNFGHATEVITACMRSSPPQVRSLTLK